MKDPSHHFGGCDDLLLQREVCLLHCHLPLWPLAHEINSRVALEQGLDKQGPVLGARHDRVIGPTTKDRMQLWYFGAQPGLLG